MNRRFVTCFRDVAIHIIWHLIFYFLYTDTSFEDANKLKRGQEILKYGCPDQGSGVRYYGNHALTYDQQKKIPSWVAEHLTADMLTGIQLINTFENIFYIGGHYIEV